MSDIEKLKEEDLKHQNIAFNKWFKAQDINLDTIITSTLYKHSSINLTGLKMGVGMDTLSSMTLGSSWDVRETPSGVSVHLSRDHLFYKKDTYEKEKLFKIVNEANKPIILDSSPSMIYPNSLKFLHANNMLESLDSSMETINKEDQNLVRNRMTNSGSFRQEKEVIKVKMQNSSNTFENADKNELYDLITRLGRRKFSENHYAISGFNLISSNISVNEEVANTFSHNYERLWLFDQQIFTSLIKSNDEKDMVIKQINTPPYYADAGDKIKNYKLNLEFMSNTLLKEMEEAYFGKIFMKFNPKIENGDTVTLINEIDSTYGIFKIDTYEHSFGADGLYTMVSVKANVRHVDPSLDYYSQKIGLSLLEDLEELTQLDPNNVVFSNIHALALKCLIQNFKYASVYGKQEPKYFGTYFRDIWGEDKTKNKTTLKNERKHYGVSKLPIKFNTMIVRGHEMIPTSLIGAFYQGEPELLGIMDLLELNISNAVKRLGRNVKEWSVSMATYVIDLALSFATLGLHELLKPRFGTTRENATEVFKKEVLTEEQYLSILNGEQYFSSDFRLGKPEDLKIGFFNTMAQGPYNLYPEVSKELGTERANSINKEHSKETRLRIKNKENINKKFIDETFDIMLGVEYYDGFNIKNLDYNLNNFIANCSDNSNYGKLEIFENRYGKEYGLVWWDKEKFPSGEEPTIDNNLILEEEKRRAIVCKVDVTEYNLEGVTHINIISFHNLFGKAEDINKRIANINKLFNSLDYLRVDGEEVVIMADFNLHIANNNLDVPSKSSSVTQNAYMVIDSKVFKNYINKATTLSTSTNGKNYEYANRYDNVLVGSKLHKFLENGKIKVNRYAYQHDKKSQISDHLPVYLLIRKEG